MSQESNHKKKPQRRLTVETMEDRLLLSISPGGPFPTQNLVDVEYVPPTMQEASSRIDLFDFNEIARQYNSVQVSEHVGATMPVPTLPEAGTAMKIADPTTFLNASGDQTQAYTSMSDRLSDELSLMDWGSMQSDSSDFRATSNVVVNDSATLSENATDRAEQVDGNTSAVRLDLRQEPEMRENVAPPKDDFIRMHDGDVRPDFTLNETFDPFLEVENGIKTVQITTGGDLLAVNIDMQWGMKVSEKLLGPVTSFDVDMSDASLDLLYYTFNMSLSDAGILNNMENMMPAGYRPGDRGVIFDIMPNAPGALDLALEGGFMDHLGGPEVGQWFDFLPHEGSSNERLAGSDYSDSQAPPSTYGSNMMDVLRMTSNTFYQQVFNSTYGSNSMNQTSPHYMSPDGSYVLGTGNSENPDTEESLLGSSNSGNGNLDDAERLVENLEIKGLLNTDPENFLVESETDSEGEGGMIDFSIAMKYAQHPVVATPEGIVQAVAQQDNNKVALEGSYGRLQTFELATAEDEVEKTDDPAAENVSAALLKELNQMPLNLDNKEGIDKTDTTPAMHEVALGQVSGELGYASLLPSDALSWVTFAFVGQQAVRQPGDEKKKKKS